MSVLVADTVINTSEHLAQTEAAQGLRTDWHSSIEPLLIMVYTTPTECIRDVEFLTVTTIEETRLIVVGHCGLTKGRPY